jgi:hypothetical protein
MLLVAPVVDRLQGSFLKDEGSVDDVADRPLALAVLVVPRTLAGAALFLAAGPPDLSYELRTPTRWQIVHLGRGALQWGYERS